MRKKVFQNSSSSGKKLILKNALEIIFEFGRHFWPKRYFRAIFGHFHIIKRGNLKNLYIGEKKSEKITGKMAPRHLEK